MNHPDAVSNIAIPMFDTMLAHQMTAKAVWLNAPQRVGDGSGLDAVELTPTLKDVSVCVDPY